MDQEKNDLKKLQKDGGILTENKLTAQDKIRAKETALRMGRDLNPNVSAPMNQGTLGYSLNTPIPPNIEKVLADSKTIYAWLIE